MCEEFHCLPSAAYREWLTAPAGLLDDILDMRAYAALKREYDGLKTAKEADAFRAQGETAELVETIAMEIQAEAMREQTADD